MRRAHLVGSAGFDNKLLTGAIDMRRHTLLLFLSDLALMALAALGALYLRENLDVPAERLVDFLPYLAITLAVSAVVLIAFGLNRSIWRFSGMVDYLNIAAAVAIVVLGSVSLGFLANRLEGVSRSLPIIQGLLSIIILVTARVIARLRHASRMRDDTLAVVASPGAGAGEVVLVVGINRITALFLQAIAEHAADDIRVAGLLAKAGQHQGRSLRRHNVLGTPEDVVKVLRQLETHGVHVDRIVVTMAFDRLSQEAQEQLLKVERSSNIKLDLFAERLRMDVSRGEGARHAGVIAELHPASNESPPDYPQGTPDEVARSVQRTYWSLKRGLDFTAAAVLLLLVSPIMLAVAVLVALDLGAPVVFWQQRPGLNGRPFKVYKFRSMGNAHDSRGRHLTDEERQTRFGRLLRRSRLDELPQLLNILKGDMSFIGPRPLLPIDQVEGDRVRHLVRPGLTGWAQVMGGREVGVKDKAVLDAWYVHNASLGLDVEIALRTIPIILRGERLNQEAIDRAWRDLSRGSLPARISELQKLKPPAVEKAA